MHIETPLLRSTPMSHIAGCDVWLKMESSQPSGSFKMRGMGRAAETAVAAGATRLVSSSGGNAGLAVACAGRILGVPVTVIVPRMTPAAMRERIAAEGAEVQVHGQAWDDAHARAIEVAAQGGALMHPFDHPDVWAGHSTLVHELMDEPDAVVVAVGGGGLLRGVLDGFTERGWSPTVYAAETLGTDSLARALEAGEPVDRGGIEGIALTLGARQVAEGCRTRAAEWGVRSLRVTDLATVRACERFADDHRVLVEPACGAALACVYDGLVGPHSSILVVVCGGAAATRADLARWRAHSEQMEETSC